MHSVMSVVSYLGRYRYHRLVGVPKVPILRAEQDTSMVFDSTKLRIYHLCYDQIPTSKIRRPAC